jgi:hypothetical protein
VILAPKSLVCLRGFAENWEIEAAWVVFAATNGK